MTDDPQVPSGLSDTTWGEALDEDETLQKLREVAIAKLAEGDPAFWRMLLDRVWPVRHELSGPGGGPLVSFADLARQAAEVRRDRQLED